ncbi:acyl carrier protein [Kibdelosporangium aridum]|uniref:Methoxymalonate biosynthesis acyl carrier protein n=1 Tax=Kibdelosporangium aridum TaxID=2030 RepID=A0A1W2AWF2_KIBAR|nr:phosphopantetheine-binding protein [Kibdelosporangium aridum]SMC64880.1 methoxymalonate biosynthesis acyl carrier protein [Kibdelosporangium aridum]
MNTQTIEANLVEFLQQRTKSTVGTDVDLFAAGLVSSLFALELVTHLESTFGVEVSGDELNLDNFRTVDAMAALVTRLRGGSDD